MSQEIQDSSVFKLSDGKLSGRKSWGGEILTENKNWWEDCEGKSAEWGSQRATGWSGSEPVILEVHSDKVSSVSDVLLVLIHWVRYFRALPVTLGSLWVLFPAGPACWSCWKKDHLLQSPWKRAGPEPHRESMEYEPTTLLTLRLPDAGKPM